MTLRFLLALAFSVHGLCGQTLPITPATPKAFKKRALGGSLGSSAVGVREPAKSKVVTKQFIAVSDLRDFVSTEGKKVRARLIAFEEGDATKAKRPLTLIKESKIRLLVEGKATPSIIPLTRLREEDQDFVRAVDLANKKATEPKPSKDAP